MVWTLVGLAIVAVLTTQLMLGYRVAEAPECICPAARDVKCTEVIELPCSEKQGGANIDMEQLQQEALARKADKAKTSPGLPEKANKQLPPVPRVKEPPLTQSSSTQEEEMCLAQEDPDLVTEEWARRLASFEWHRKCAEAPTGGDVVECLTQSHFITEDWIAKMRQLEQMPSIGEVARMAEELTQEEPQLEKERIRVSGQDLIYGDPGVEGKFFIETEGYPFGGAVFRATLEGPEIVNAVIVDHQNGRYSGSYLVATAGLYKVTIVFEAGRYENSAIPPYRRTCDGAVIYQGDLQITGISFKTPSYLCPSIPMMTNGRHVWSRSEDGKSGGEKLQWQPWQCGLHRDWTVEQFQQCVEERHLGRILFLGASSTFAIFKALGGDSASSPAYCLFSKDVCAYLPLHFASTSINDVNSLLPRHMPAWTALLSGRGPLSTVAMPGRRNVLLWNVGTREIIEDQPLSQFAIHAEEVVAAIQRYWDGDHFFRTPTALHRRCSGEPERYWSLTNERMAEYSSAVREVVLRGGGHILDSFNITAAMRGSTSDAKSYNRELYHELAILVLNALCVADDWL